MSDFPAYLWVDVEASGLHRGSYPIEIGWCDGNLEATSFLIKPLPTWSISEWSPTSERVHGISYKTVIECGFEAADVAAWLNAAATRKVVLSDNPEIDNKWLHKLFAEVGIHREFEIEDALNAMSRAARENRLSEGEAQALVARIHRRFPHPHRAGPDARRAAAEFLAVAMPHEVDAIIALA